MIQNRAQALVQVDARERVEENKSTQQLFFKIR